jgi:hypothetical protein
LKKISSAGERDILSHICSQQEKTIMKKIPIAASALVIGLAAAAAFAQVGSGVSGGQEQQGQQGARHSGFPSVPTANGQSNDESADAARYGGNDGPNAEPDAKDVYDHGTEAGYGSFQNAGHFEGDGQYDHHPQRDVSTDGER